MCVCFVQRKCEQYWSDNVNEVYSPSNTTLLVVLTEQMPFADYEIKKFSVTDVSMCVFINLRTIVSPRLNCGGVAPHKLHLFHLYPTELSA